MVSIYCPNKAPLIDDFPVRQVDLLIADGELIEKYESGQEQCSAGPNRPIDQWCPINSINNVSIASVAIDKLCLETGIQVARLSARWLRRIATVIL